MPNIGETHENLDHKVYTTLRNMITERKLLPGQKIPQEKLAHDLGISRTPLISALKFLEKEKIVESKPRRGFFVRLFELQELINIFELREVLEGLAARRAAMQITSQQINTLKTFFTSFHEDQDIRDYKAYAQEDRKFHIFIAEIGSKEFLKSILETYNIIIYSYQLVNSEGLVRPPNETVHEHFAIIDAIRNGDAENAEKHMRMHFRKSMMKLT